jgi:hypothetical protein
MTHLKYNWTKRTEEDQEEELLKRKSKGHGCVGLADVAVLVVFLLVQYDPCEMWEKAEGE